MEYNWAPMMGDFEFYEDMIVFRGQPVEYDEEFRPALGNAICNQRFAGGSISADVSFSSVGERNACEIILYYEPATRYFVSAGLGPDSLYSIRHLDTKWTYDASAGNRANLEAERTYRLKVRLRGSRVTLCVDGVEVLVANLPFGLPQSQVGIWCLSDSDITISNYQIEAETPRIFVVMQFGSPYDELYQQVIRVVCGEFGLEAVRADETYGPGLILADVIKQIIESKFIIAEITPSNPNVYYELGYAHASNKPTILIAEKPTKLPFDVSPFRTLFYENTINGKVKIEEGLRSHIKAILSESHII